MKRHDLMSSIILFLAGLFTLLSAPQYDLGSPETPGPGLMPFLSGILMCIFSIVTFFKAYLDKSGQMREIWVNIRFRKLTFVFLMLLLYTLFLEKVGFLVCTFFFIFLLLRFVEPQPWLTSLLGGGLTSILAYLLFETWLKAQLPRGILGF